MKDRFKILILEHNDADYKLICSELKKTKFNIKTSQVTDETSFKESITSFNPDLILSDYNTPEFDGMEALLYTQKTNPQIPFIIITGSTNEEIAVDCIKAGATDYVTKEHLARLTYAITGALKQNLFFKEKSLAESTLIESEERYRSIFEKSADPLLLIENYHFVDCNDATLKFLGYESRTELFNIHPAELSPEFQPDGQKSTEKVIKMIDQAIQDGNNRFEWIHTTKQGKQIWVDVSLTRIKGGKDHRIFTLWKDISERKVAQLTQKVIYNISEASEKITSLEELFEKIHKELGKIIDNKNFYIALYNEVNDTYTFPFYEDEFDEIDPESEENMQGSLTDFVRKGGKGIRITREIEKKLSESQDIKIHGSMCPVWIGAPLFDSISNSVIGVAAIQNYEDENALTDKDLLLLEFIALSIGKVISKKRTELIIKDSEEQFRSLAQTATDAILMIDNDGLISFWNESASKIFLYSKEEAIGKSLHDLIVPIQYHKKAKPAFEKFRITGEGNAIGKTLEMTGKRKDGEIFPLELSISKVKKEDQWYATGIIRDITERKIAELEIKRVKEKAVESDKLKTAFLANMSHEIRTPMNAILGFSELLGLQDITEDERKEFIELIQNNSNNLLNLINDIIDIAKIEAKQLHISEGEFSINDLLSDILKTYNEIKNKQDKTHIDLALLLPDGNDELFIITDKYRVNQVISNLVGNALKYTETGKIEFGYKLIKDPDNSESLQFYITDTGIGIPIEKLNVIFDRFRQADESHTRLYGGTGLGLAISKNIADLLHGTITVESQENEGSTFYFTIPLKKASRKTIKSITPHSPEQLDLSDKTILVAEDVESNFQLLSTYLKKTKVKIIWAMNGQEAVEVCQTNNDIDLVLMDMQMPIMNGYEATKKIKSFKPELPIIAETAFALAGDREKILKAGCDDYISKPIHAKELYKKINFYLSND